MTTGRSERRVVLVLLGAAGLVLKASYQGPLAEVVHSYAGNVAASFAVYFLAAIAASRRGAGSLAAAAVALAIVEAFEVTDGFGVMSNVYDPVDLLANAAGVGVALAVDGVARRPAASAGAGPVAP
jgi:hypothetical protein